MKEKIKELKFILKAGQATVAPPVGPMLNKYSINANTFIKEYNEKTKEFVGTFLPVRVNIYEDKTYDFDVLKQTTSNLLKKQFDLKKKENLNAYLDEKDLFLIYLDKKDELNSKNEKSCINMIKGTLKNMKIPFINKNIS